MFGRSARGQKRIAGDRHLFHDRVGMRAPPVDDAIEHRMNNEAARIRLESGLHDFPALAESAGENRKLRALGKRVEIALAAGERLGRAGKALRGQQSRPETVARRIADVNAFGRRAEAFAKARGLGRGKAKGEDHWLGLKRKKFGTPGGGAEHPAGRGDVPAPPVMARGHR